MMTMRNQIDYLAIQSSSKDRILRNKMTSLLAKINDYG